VARFWFEWDPAKSLENERKHGVLFEEAVSVLQDPLAITYADPDHSLDEEREITKGYSNRGRLLVVAHVERGGRFRIITARRATARERRKHEEEDSG
jgi:hypothetical protein